MSLEENKTIVRRFIEEVANKNNQSVAEELVADNFINHNPGPGQQPDGESFKKSFAGSHTSFPDIQYSIENILAEGDKVAVLWTQKGTHKGQWGPVAPTGKQYKISGTFFFRLANGKLAELWSLADIWNLSMQLGLLPPPGPPRK